MFRFCNTSITNTTAQLPARLQQNINRDLAFVNEFDLKSPLIVLRVHADNFENRRAMQFSVVGAVMLSLGIYSVYDMYFSKTDKQIVKLKLSAKCYAKSFYKNDVHYILDYLHDMKNQGIRNTAFMIYLLQITNQCRYSNDAQLMANIFAQVGEIVLSNQVYIKQYSHLYCKQASILIDGCVVHRNIVQSLALPAMITYLYSDNILYQIQSLYTLLHSYLPQQYNKLLIDKLQNDKCEFKNITTLFDILSGKIPINDKNVNAYSEFEQQYQDTLMSQKQQLIKLVLLKYQQ